jgi:hypothetical protein
MRPLPLPKLLSDWSIAANGEASRAWAAALGDLFQAAAGSAGLIERHYAIADRRVCLRFAGSSLAEVIAPSFAHLESDPTNEPALTVELWDAQSADTGEPPLPAIDEHGADQAVGALYQYSDEHVRAVYQPGFNALTVLCQTKHDRRPQTAFYWMRRAADLPYWERATPIRQLLHWWLAAHDVQQVHAAAVGAPTGGVLLVGNPGSGKSTSALSSLESSLLFAGDDYVAVALEPEPFVFSLYSSGKIDPQHVAKLPHVMRSLANADKLDTEKAVMYAHDHYPDKTTPGFPLRAVLLPTIRDRIDSRIVPVSRGAALRALAPSTVIQLHTAGPDALARMKALVAQVPAFTLELGSDIRAIPRTIEGFLHQGLAK